MSDPQSLPNCPRCNVAPELQHVYGFTLICRGCFDYADDLVSGLYASGITKPQAEDNWRTAVNEWIEDNTEES